MWFRNLTLYRLPAPWAMASAELEHQLARGIFQRCPANAPKSRGWTPPRGDGPLVHAVNGQWLLCLAIEKRLLPVDVVNRTVRELAEQRRAERGYAPGRKETRELREQVVAELLPKSFTQVRRVFVWIDPRAGWLGIDSQNYAIADEVIEHLRHCLDTFPLALVHTTHSPAGAMAGWLVGDAPAGFTLDRDAELKARSAEKATVSYRHCPLEGDDIKGRLAAGMLPTRVALTWNDRLSFVLTEKGLIKRLTFLDLIKEQAEQDAENADEQFDADFALMSGELRRFIPALLQVLGGEVAP